MIDRGLRAVRASIEADGKEVLVLVDNRREYFSLAAVAGEIAEKYGYEVAYGLPLVEKTGLTVSVSFWPRYGSRPIARIKIECEG